ncbi:MAG: HAMP domain-containing histidine kinase [Clostridiales bacterium]|nr:HAMP domain-containing histidine kinase [Clostridiales bacterium]
MVTKLRNYNNEYYNQRMGACIIIFVISVTVLAIAIIGLITLTEAQGWLDDHTLKVKLIDMNEPVILSNYINAVFKKISVVALISAVLTCVSFVASLAFAGSRDENGDIRLNWFDKIFGEIQITAMIAVAVTAILLTGNYAYNYFYMRPNIILKTEYAIFDYLQEAESFYTSFLDIWIAIGVMLVASLFCLLIFISLVKKGKARCFTNYTMIGRLIKTIERSLSYKASVYWKLLAILIVGAVLSFISFETLILVIVIILIILPKAMDKYYGIKEAIRQLQQGNLDYQIEIKGKSELDKLSSDINDISDSMRGAIESETKNQKTKTQLISNVSHDIKTPLTSMITYIDLLKFEGLDSENAAEYVRVIDEKTRRLKKLTEDLFDAAKASSGDFPVDLVEIDLSAIVNQSIGEMDNYFEPKDLEIVFNSHIENTKVYADGRLLYRILENLLVNASKYSIEGSRIYIDIHEDNNGFLKLIIKNISKAQLNVTEEELMERFMRGDESRTSDGSGLGLSIAKDLALLISGKFDIHIDGDYFKANLYLKKQL